MPSSGERALVDQQREPLARGELALLVLAGDPLLAAAEPRALAALVEVVHQRAERRPRDQRVGGRSLGAHRLRQVVEERLEHVHRGLGGHRALLVVVRHREVRDLEAEQLGVLEHGVDQVVELVGVEAVRGRHRPREVLGIDHVQVEVHEHRRAVERVLRRHERLDGARADHRRGAPLEQLALARVEVADPSEHHALRRHRLAQAGVPLAGGGGEAHAAEVAAAGGLGRVVVAVRVEPEDARVGPVPDRGGQRGRGHRAVGGEQHGRVTAGERVVDLAAGLEQAAARVAQVVLVAGLADLAGRADVARLDAERPRHQRREDLHAARRAREAVGGAAAQRYERDAHALSVPSSAARASRRRPSRPPGCPPW